MGLIDTAKADWFELPHEPGGKVQLRQLTRGEKKDAQIKGYTIEAESPPVTMGVLEAQLEADVPVDQFLGLYEAEGYHWELLLNAGLVGWSYDVPCTPENIARLDDLTQRFAVLTILGLSRTSRAEGEVGSSNSETGPPDDEEPSAPPSLSTLPSAASGG